MSKLLIRVDNHDQPYTVSEMRKRLAQVLSKLNGDQEVAFTFVATLENYEPTRTPTIPAILGAPYNLEQGDPVEGRDGLWGYAKKLGFSTEVCGEIARPEND